MLEPAIRELVCVDGYRATVSVTAGTRGYPVGEQVMVVVASDRPAPVGS